MKEINWVKVHVLVEAIAEEVGFDLTEVFGVTIDLDEKGVYVGADIHVNHEKYGDIKSYVSFSSVDEK
jgi:hypothetical protein